MIGKKLSQEHLNTLGKYFPKGSLEVISGWIVRYRIYLVITRHRQSKHGDFATREVDELNRISVNGTLNPYAFLITFVHEVAHLVTFRCCSRYAQPHGKEWKLNFVKLMDELDLRGVFPSDILGNLLDYLKNPLASTDRHTGLAIALKSHDLRREALTQGEVRQNSCFIEQLPIGADFFYQSERIFRVMEKRRKLYLCKELATGRDFLFQPHAFVEIKPNIGNEE